MFIDPGLLPGAGHVRFRFQRFSNVQGEINVQLIEACFPGNRNRQQNLHSRIFRKHFIIDQSSNAKLPSPAPHNKSSHSNSCRTFFDIFADSL
jgi:hypothetical protein